MPKHTNLGWDNAEKVKLLLNDGVSVGEIAKRFSVSTTLIYDIKNGRIYLNKRLPVDKEAARAKRNAYYVNYRKEWKKRPHASHLTKKWHLHNKYGLTVEEYDATWSRQGMRCAICKTDKHCGRGWCVDHCHATDRFRGILCMPCNLAIGYFRDNKKSLESAILYLS